MRRVLMCGMGMLLAICGCPSQQQPDPQPGVVSVLTAGSYSGTLSCVTVDVDGKQVRQSTQKAQVLVTAEGGLRLFKANIAPDATITEEGTGYVIEEHVDAIEEAGDTVTMRTSGTLTAGDEVILMSRVATLKQVDPQTLDLTNATHMQSESTGEEFTTTCSGNVTQ
jgi:hypothetical protein